MKNYIAVIISVILIIWSSNCFASYSIDLKNGATFITYHYWKEGNQVKFYCYGGVVGIERDLILEIEQSDLSYIAEEKRQRIKEKFKTETKDKKEIENDKEIHLTPNLDKEALLREKSLIKREIEAVSDSFKDAKAKNNRKQVNEARQRLLLLQTALSKLKEKERVYNSSQEGFLFD